MRSDFGRLRRTLRLALLLVAIAGPAAAERLATRRFSTVDGLASDFVISLYRDSRGFLWFSTRDGVSRFDGAKFTTYGLADGLPNATINAVYETRAGVHWIATNGGGVSRLNPRGGPLFVSYRIADDAGSNYVNVLFEDRAGTLWAGTDGGLFRLDPENGEGFRRVEVPLLPADRSFHGINALIEDAEGSLWIGGGWGVMRRLPTGRFVSYRIEPPGARDGVHMLRIDRDRRVWVAFRAGLLVLDPESLSSFDSATTPLVRAIARRSGVRWRSPAPSPKNEPAVLRWYTAADGLHDGIVTALYLGPDGRVLAGTMHGLAERIGDTFRAYGAAQGLPEETINAIADDPAGNLWIGSVSGATRLIPHGLLTFDQADGLNNARVRSLHLSREGRLFVITGDYVLSRFDGGRFQTIRPALPPDATCSWMSWCGLLDRDGRWWLMGTFGLHQFSSPARFEDLARRPAETVHPQRGSVVDVNMYSGFQDRAGNIWVGSAPGGLYRFERATGQWREFTDRDGLPAIRRLGGRVSAFAEDRDGRLWLGFSVGGIARFHDGRFDSFGAADGVPLGTISSLLADASGGVWIGSTQGGLGRIGDPSAARPAVVPFTAAHGLSTNNVRCLTDDDRGRIYVGTSRGVDRIDPISGAVKHFSVGEGLASEFVTVALRDREGYLWFGSVTGLSRLDPRLESARPDASDPVPIFIASLRVGGTAQPVSELGETSPGFLTLTPTRNQLEVGFFGFGYEGGSSLKYQYRLEGADSTWGPSTELRSVNYARLAPGTYRFQVRAVRADGAVSATPALVAFRVLPPFYTSWWFLSLLGLGVAAGALVLYRVRVARLLGVERVRARIATDLHDDIGSSLSQIAILAEVARERLGREQIDPAAAEPLARIAETSRGLVDSMSDIVWAINPEVDTLSDLVHRMRRFAEDTLGGSDIEVTFRAPEPGQDLKLGADVRREVFLILKEGVTNIAKHADCSRVGIELSIDRRHLRLRVADNGGGFDPHDSTDGNGVASMRRRVAALGGRLAIASAAGQGTTITLDVDLARSGFLPS